MCSSKEILTQKSRPSKKKNPEETAASSMKKARWDITISKVIADCSQEVESNVQVGYVLMEGSFEYLFYVIE